MCQVLSYFIFQCVKLKGLSKPSVQLPVQRLSVTRVLVLTRDTRDSHVTRDRGGEEAWSAPACAQLRHFPQFADSSFEHVNLNYLILLFVFFMN